jgi:hypothetical protein
VALLDSKISVAFVLIQNKNQNGGISMETKYFEYSRNGDNEKYSEFTEDEYLKAREDESRRFISFGNSVLECEKSQYTDYFTQKNHGEYAQKDKNWKKVIPVSLEEYTYDGNYEQKIIKDSTAVPFEEQISEQLSLEQDLGKLKKIMQKLKPYEREIIFQIFWLNESQKSLGDKYGKSQQNMNKITKRILAKMLKLIKNEK